MIEVFKTNVESCENAAWLISQISAAFPLYTVNFDLEDCDRIMRVKGDIDIDSQTILELLAAAGFEAQILEDIILTEPRSA